ncbi:MAG: UDP-N-acetylmuramoyl-L-alanyl-D-glutamate--2,6-diaminopimelate ligase, partial [Desulfovibrionaceae bacterium]|nr:UDP-N-acetylmuramoyl-L-alanyl-D-glutamate--2,6-diaminopimelate ligase [Desulfovibrionaceae bacterium]
MKTPSSFEELLTLVRKQHIPVYTDSRHVTKGSIFIAQQGSQADGRAFIYQATMNGAHYIVVEGEYVLPNSSVIVFCVDDIHKAEALLAKALYQVEQYSPTYIGITGTNGKTTTSFLLEHLFTHLHKRVGVFGTVNYRYPNHTIPAPLTTPSCLQMYSVLEKMQEEHVDTVIMEVSSHALHQRRTEGISFNGAIFTNLTQDHLDYHSSMEEYFEAKALLFERNPHAVMAINADDPHGRILLERFPQSIGFSLLHNEPYHKGHLLRGMIHSLSIQGTTLTLQYNGVSWEFHSKLIGKFNAYNILGVCALALGMGISHTELTCLEEYTGVVGRLERIDASNCFVDYAHTPDALINVLQTLKDSGFKRIITVFGCGGDRDTTKRPLMREAVEKYSDIFIVTSDNPRTEDPHAIIKDILHGMKSTKEYYV